MLDQAGELREALVALLDKLDAMEGPLNGMCMMGHIHGSPYDGPQWGEEYNRGRELTGTKKIDEANG